MGRVVALATIAAATIAGGLVAAWAYGVRSFDVNRAFASAATQQQIEALDSLWPPVQVLGSLVVPALTVGLVAALAAIALQARRWELSSREPAPSATADRPAP